MGEFLMNTTIVKFLIAKINEVIAMYPAQFNMIKEYLHTVVGFVVEWTKLLYNKLMTWALIKKIIDFILDLINRKDLYTTMASSLSSVSASVSSYSAAVASNVPVFVKLHTPSSKMSHHTITGGIRAVSSYSVNHFNKT